MIRAFSVLGLSPDADERAIKRAYAARLKAVRPDEDPEGFQRLNEAYRAALEYHAARGSVRVSMQRETPSSDPATDGSTRSEDVRPSEDVPPSVPAPATPLPAFPPPLPPVRWRTQSLALNAFTASGPALVPAFDTDAFFRELHARAAREPVAAFRAWLLGHEALYAMALKDALAVPLLHFLAGAAPMRREHLDETLRFFGLDTISPRTQRLETALHRLRENALRDGPDWERIMSHSANGAPRRPASARTGSGSRIPLWPILVGLYVLTHIARLFGHA